ncbi:MAG: CBS domain-containing protein [Gemmatimonadetes bacterium]|nr:CBS domain-containing protein [Gemmatimonadota bacterium]NIQ53117.1 CBS domain-containing protein [Gemmatimonadota bacterium]NIU73263.1 CBS domain-containing protein [Gammaproteobacteria bacterium]NIX43526.1 CBS domain-containing protein [Gemmatimonadota bacterium]NIY07704.1 CBS domain-containing protein [Gemmatimonadota bacterium]
MTRDVVTVSLEATVANALETIRSNNIRHLPVVDGGRLLGVVTDRDLRMALDAEGRAARDSTVSDVMSAPPVTVDPGTPIETAAGILAERRIGCLPVLEDGELVGILTESDLLRAFVELMAGRERHSRLEILAPDRPGELARVVRVIGIDHGINITGVVVPPPHGDRALVILHLESDDVGGLVETLRRLGYEAGSPALGTRPE